MAEPIEERMVDKIKKLLDRAAHPNTPEPEAEACLRRADDLMVKYSIDQALLNAAKSKEEREKPERRDVDLFEASHPLRGDLSVIAGALASLCDVRVVRISGDKHAVVGYAADIDYFELVFLGVRNQFQQRMFPQWDPEGDLDRNIYQFKVAGYKWAEIWHIGATKHSTPMPCSCPPNDGGWFIRAYKRHAKKIGDDKPITTQRFDAYRKSYRAGFVETINERVRTMVWNRKQNVDSSGSGAEVALRDRRQDVLNLLYDEFPGLRPKTKEQLRREAQEEAEKRRKEAEEYKRWYEGLTPRQREAEDRKRERQEAANARWWADFERRNRTDHQGYGAGRSAAAQADLSGGRNTVGRSKEIDR